MISRNCLVDIPEFVYVNLASILTLRKNLHMSQQYVADNAGISTVAVRRLETGTAIPSQKIYNRLAKFFDWEIWE